MTGKFKYITIADPYKKERENGVFSGKYWYPRLSSVMQTKPDVENR
jgi:hypothetical protein